MLSWLWSLIRSIWEKFLNAFWRRTPKDFTLPVHIKVAGGKSFLVEMSTKWDVAKIKKFIEKKVGLKAEEISIILAGKSLADSLLLEVCNNFELHSILL